MKKSLEIQSAIIAVKKQTLMVTTKIIQNLLKLCGYASDATLNYIGGK